MIRRPPRSTQSRSSAASDVYKRQELGDLTVGREDDLAVGGADLGDPKGHVLDGADHALGDPRAGHADEVTEAVLALGDDEEAVSYTHLRAHETRHDLVC